MNNKLVSKLDPFTFYVVKTKAAFQGRTVCTRLFYCFGFSLFLYLLFVFWNCLSSLTFLVFLIIFIFLAYSFIVFNEPVSKKLFCQCKIITQKKTTLVYYKTSNKGWLVLRVQQNYSKLFLDDKMTRLQNNGIQNSFKKTFKIQANCSCHLQNGLSFINHGGATKQWEIRLEKWETWNCL